MDVAAAVAAVADGAAVAAVAVAVAVAAVAVAVAVVATVMNGCAVPTNVLGVASVREVADGVGVSQRSMIPFAVPLAAGALGLVAGLDLPAVGIVAALGLVVHVVGALIAHLRAGAPAVHAPWPSGVRPV